MTNGPNESSKDPKILDNPYPKGSARYKLKQRQLDKQRKEEAAKKKKKTPKDKSKRRKYLDEQIDG